MQMALPRATENIHLQNVSFNGHMAPAFIADSDDESEVDTFSPPPAAQAEDPPSFASTRSGPASLATSSTDPVFFQGIYKEQQIAAAREQQLRDGGGGSGSLQQAAPAGSEQTDPVSLPSQYPEGTSLALGGPNRGHASHAVKSAIMRDKRMRQDIAGAVDPYAFPSSAEEDQSSGGRAAGRMTATESYVAYCGTEDAGIGDNENMRPPSRKRQRFNGSGKDGMDSSLPPTAPPIYSSIPPTMPPGDIGEMGGANHAEIPGSLEPTMSIGEDASLIINARGLTSSQKEQYIALELPVSSIPERRGEHGNVLPQIPPQSSAQSQRQKTRSKRSTPSKSKATKQLRGKSQRGGDVAASIQLGTPEQTQEQQSAAVLLDSDDEGCELNGHQAVKETKVEDDIYDIQPSPVKPSKKKRGRPKKAGKETEEAAALQMETTEGKQPGKVGRKRGRPKKLEPVVVEEAEAVAEALDEASTKVPDEDGAKDDTKNKADADAEEVIVPRHVKVDIEKAPETPLDAAKATLQKPARKGTETPQNGTSGKPLYRIGLSKRSRIAPLLKSLPK
ncbi:hypothetical protein LLEC1_06434 [Akanthomyces lecanii]|uniref:AT hook domain-containing protein n=1 Tax=Cordyceps confragosa TaxID=2714763 RepID=A0A179IMD7_CORDF|nr:hypothetical protein LLEC1_06434 [Akanthomyces lecanii]